MSLVLPPRRVTRPDPPPPLRRRQHRDLLALLLLLGASIGQVVWQLPVLRRPLYYDEQWRAYHVLVWDGWYRGLPTDSGPLAYGWLAWEKVSLQLLGTSPLAFRLPMAAALPVLVLTSYVLARHWCRPAISLVVAGVLCLHGSVIGYGFLLKPYLMELAVTSVLVLLWVRGLRARGGRRVVLLTAVGATALLSVPALLLAGPLLAISFVRSLRRPRELLAPLCGGLLVLVAAAWLSGQLGQRDSGYWTEFYLTQSPWQRLVQAGGSFVPEVLTSALLRPEDRPGHPFSGSALFEHVFWPLRFVAGVALLLLLAAAVGAVRRHRGDRWVPLAALGAGMAGVLLGAATGSWPALWTRVNLFLLPLVLVSMGVGAEALLRQAVPRARRAWQVALVGVALLLVGIGSYWTVLLHGTGREPLLLDHLPEVAADIRARAEPGDVLLEVVNRKQTQVWVPALRLYFEGLPAGGPPLGQSRTLVTYRPTRELSALLDRQPTGLWLLSLQDHPSSTQFDLQRHYLEQAGWCMAGGAQGIWQTGDWARFVPGGCITAPADRAAL